MRRDDAHLEDIRLACERIIEFVRGMTLAAFLQDVKTRSAVERQITIMGEAANRVSAETKAAHPEVPWQQLVRLRNFYMHGYDRLTPDEVWGTARRLAPRVRRLIAPLIPPDGETE